MTGGLLVLGLTLLAAMPASAATQHRYALVVGSNLGESDETPLRYAERDAARLGDVLVRLGGVQPQNMLLVRGGSPAAVQGVLVDLAGRIARQRRTQKNSTAMLLIYYSGHASAGAMHLNGERLSFDRLRSLVRKAGADVSVFIVDACRSGGLTRVKGAAPAEPFEIKVDDRLQSHGEAIITSSAQGEDAQESDRLRGGIFTHHLIGGLLGAADHSDDDRVTLAEAYRYAYGETLRTTSRTRFVQHPTYSLRLKGRQDVTLTRISAGAGLGRLHLRDAGDYLIIDEDRGDEVVAELAANARTDLLLARGRYLIRRRGKRAVAEARVPIAAGRRTVLAAEVMKQVPYGQTVRRGMQERNIWSVGAGATLAGPILNGLSNNVGGALGLQVDLEELALHFRVRYANAGGQNNDLTLTQDSYGVDLGAYKLFDIPAISLGLGLGVRIGGDAIQQQFETTGSAPQRRQWVWRAAPVARLEFTPWSTMAFTLDCGVDVHLARLADGADEAWQTPSAPFCGLSWSFYLP